MKNYINELSKEARDLIRLAADTACAGQVCAYLVGGFVRDLILGFSNLDLDICVEGDGISYAESLAKALAAKLVRHRRFGTATITLRHGLKIDISTMRRESYPEPASLPLVSPGTLRDDLSRRDFTINAMAISIRSADFGRLIDFFNGEQDLRAKKIRILHSASFIDDPTRILRAIRFEQRYGFRIELVTLKYLKDAVEAGMISKVQPQRLRDELVLMLSERHPRKLIRRMQELAGLSFIDRRLSVSKRTYALLDHAEKEITWFNQAHIHRRRLDTWLIYFMAMIDNLSLEVIKHILRKFVFRKGDEKRILSAKDIKRWLILRLSREGIKPSEVFHLLDPLSYEVILLLKAKYRLQAVRRHIAEFLKAYNDMRIHVSGNDLQRMGVSPGPHYQQIFLKVLNARLDGVVKTREEELALVEKLALKR